MPPVHDIEDEDVKIALDLVEAVAKYYSAVNDEPFDPVRYRKVELELHQVAVVYGRRLNALRGGKYVRRDT